jgi:hypothetical protein
MPPTECRVEAVLTGEESETWLAAIQLSLVSGCSMCRVLPQHAGHCGVVSERRYEVKFYCVIGYQPEDDATSLRAAEQKAISIALK